MSPFIFVFILWLYHDWFPLEFYLPVVFLWCSQKSTPNRKYLLELINEKQWRKSQWKTFSENYKPITVYLWLAYKFTKNNCSLQLFSKFIQTQKRHRVQKLKISFVKNFEEDIKKKLLKNYRKNPKKKEMMFWRNFLFILLL